MASDSLLLTLSQLQQSTRDMVGEVEEAMVGDALVGNAHTMSYPFADSEENVRLLASVITKVGVGNFC